MSRYHRIGLWTVRSFPTFSEDPHRLADWLKACGVETVAVEATGVYSGGFRFFRFWKHVDSRFAW
jgi:hypothetical protein